VLTCGVNFDTSFARLNEVMPFSARNTDWCAFVAIAHGNHITMSDNTRQTMCCSLAESFGFRAFVRDVGNWQW